MFSLACACRKKTLERGFRYFGLQFWGECWIGTLSFDSLIPVIKDSKWRSSHCYNHEYAKCDDAHSSDCVGKASMDYIYKVVNLDKSRDEGNTSHCRQIMHFWYIPEKYLQSNWLKNAYVMTLFPIIRCKNQFLSQAPVKNHFRRFFWS